MSTDRPDETTQPPAGLPAGAQPGTAQVYLISIDSLLPDPVGHNPQLHDEENIAAIEQSVRELGPLAPGVCDAATLGMFIGTGRLEAMKRAGQTHVQFVIPPKNPDGTRMWTVIGVDDLDADQKERAAFTDNLTAVTGPGFDPEVYARMLDRGVLEGVQVPQDMHEGLLKRAGDMLLQRNGNDGDGDGSGGGGGTDGDTLTRGDSGPRPGGLSEDFLMPPFSILNAQSGRWQERKRQWLSLGIKSELGRADNVTYGDSEQITTPGLNYYRDREREGGQPDSLGAVRLNTGEGGGLSDKLAGGAKRKRTPGVIAAAPGGTSRSDKNVYTTAFRPGSDEEPAAGGGDPKAYKSQASLDAITGQTTTAAGTSIFDPVLTELAYTWFTARGARILDPFAGGSVRGIVASKLHRLYTGVDLRPEQIAANVEQGQLITPDNPPEWIAGDSRDITQLTEGGFDFVFTCPPYADLEVYSDDPRDISTMEYGEFRDAYRQIIHDSCRMLHEDRFACIVVGEVRDKRTGGYYDFVGDTVRAFVDAGLTYYNELILVTAIGSLPVRAGRQFRAGRKIGKTHQNVLVFVKGDWRKAVDYCGDVQLLEVFDPEQDGEALMADPTDEELRNAGVAPLPPTDGDEYGERVTAADIDPELLANTE